jgi:hypothetical protein
VLRAGVVIHYDISYRPASRRFGAILTADPVLELRGPEVIWAVSAEEPLHTVGRWG